MRGLCGLTGPVGEAAGTALMLPGSVTRDETAADAWRSEPASSRTSTREPFPGNNFFRDTRFVFEGFGTEAVALGF
jgi:hypothetical protein